MRLSPAQRKHSMISALVTDQAPIPPPSYHRALATALHLDALTLVTRLHLAALCAVAVQMAQRRCPPPLPAGPGGAPRTYREESLLLIALIRTLWRLSYQEVHDWLCAWPALALACGLPLGPDGCPRVPVPRRSSPSGYGLRARQPVSCCSCCWYAPGSGWA